MKCNKCGKNRVKYNVSRSDDNKKVVKRTDFNSNCLDCGEEK